MARWGLLPRHAAMHRRLGLGAMCKRILQSSMFIWGAGGVHGFSLCIAWGLIFEGARKEGVQGLPGIKLPACRACARSLSKPSPQPTGMVLFFNCEGLHVASSLIFLSLQLFFFFPRTPLHYAAANGSYQCAVTLVTAGAGVNEADCKGCSPLHYAAASDTYRR